MRMLDLVEATRAQGEEEGVLSSPAGGGGPFVWKRAAATIIGGRR